MTLGRTILAATLALGLAACGGGGSSSSGGNTGGGSSGGGGGTAADCSLSARQDWALGQLNEWYLFPDLLNTAVNAGSFGDVQSYIDAVVKPARDQGRDRFFTYITSIEEENDLIANGSNAGFGVRLAYDTGARRVFVVEAFENAPAFGEGIDRGSEIISINGDSVSSIMAANPSNPIGAVSSAFGPSDPGVTRDLGIRQPDGTEFIATVEKAEFSLDPLSDRYGAVVIDNGGTNVGYINLRTFIIEDASRQLREAFAEFRAQGIDQVILDFRYNGGGLVSVAELLGDLMAADKVGQEFSTTIFRDSKSENNDTYNFADQAQAIAATKIALIGTRGTASASELVPNAFIPYLGSNIALIGTNTFGKPVGQIARDRSACDDRLRIVAFQSINADGDGEYYNGLASVMPRTCAATDDFLLPLGDPREASIATALDFLAGRSCTAISGSANETSQVTSSEADRLLMLPPQPSAAQASVPGLY